MKKLLIYFLIAKMTFADDFANEIQSIISDITTPRIGIEPKLLNNIANPFVKHEVSEESPNIVQI